MDGEEKPFYEDDEEDKEEEKEKEVEKKAEMDPDHRLLLKNSRPLLQSRSPSVRNGQSYSR